MTRYGTSNFVSLASAIRYYKDYEGSLAASKSAVAIKIKEGSIHIGAPALKPGQRLFVIPGEGRYGIEEGSSASSRSRNPNRNNNCDGSHCSTTHGQVRSLPAGGDSNIILCKSCYDHEMAWRKDRNKDLSPSSRFPLPAWSSLKVYGQNPKRRNGEQILIPGFLRAYTFIWSPEGHPICTIKAPTLAAAKARFKREYRTSYAKYMGEVYVEVNEPDARRLGREVNPRKHNPAKYRLTVGNSNAGYTKLDISIGQAKHTGTLVPTFPKGWTKGKKAQHAQALRSAARSMGHETRLGNTGTLSGWTSAGDSLPVRYTRI